MAVNERCQAQLSGVHRSGRTTKTRIKLGSVNGEDKMNQLQPATQTLRTPIKKLTAGGLALGLALFVGATHSLATNLTWTANGGDFGTASNWDPALSPATDDKTLFTNDTSHTVTFSASSPVMDSNAFSNHAGVVTLDIGANTWNVTNNFYVGKADATSTVYLASGTLSVTAVGFPASAQLRIGDPTTNLFSCVGTLIVTNGTVEVNSAVVGPTNSSFGKLVITGPNSVFKPDNFSNPSTLTIGAGGVGSQLIVTNGGKLFVDGTLTVGSSTWASNNTAIFSGPTSAATLTTAGALRLNGDGGLLIVSNGAKISMTGSLFFGSGSSFNTGVVVGAGSAVMVGGGAQLGTGSAGGTNNYFIVYNGGFFSSTGGTFAYGANSFHVNDGVQIGGTGLMSTGLFSVVRSASNNTNHHDNFMIVTNAFVSCYYLNPQGPEETVSVLAKGTWVLTNSFFIRGINDTNAVNVGGRDASLIINGGTFINLLTADNGGGISVGASAGGTVYPGTRLVITNGGQMLTSMGTIGGNGSMCTGIVTGVGSVWSNYSGPVGFTNSLIVGTNAGGSNNNFFGVSDGGRFFTPGDLLVGNNAGASNNAASLGGPGAVASVTIQGDLRVGSAGGTSSNRLTITNATVSCGSILVGQPTVTVLNYTFTTNDITAALVVTNFCATTNNLVATVLTNCTPTVTTNSTFNVMTISSGTITGWLVQVVGTNTLVYSGGTFFFTNLQVNGIMTGTATLNVPSGYRLQGVGSIANPVTISGTLAPGTSVGTLTISNSLVLNSGATLAYELGTSSDLTIITGNLTLDGTVNISDSGGFAVGNYTLITYAGTLTNNGLGVGTTPNPSLSYAIVAGGGSVVLQVTAGDLFTTWQTYYFPGGGPNAAASADPDGDGVSNTNEFLSSFNPTNSAAFARVTSIGSSGGGTNQVITYLGASGDSSYAGGPASRTNVLEFSPGTNIASVAGNYTNNFSSTGLTNILSGGTGLGSSVSQSISGAATNRPARYYRVRVLAP